MSPMLSSSTNLGLFKTIVLNFEWFARGRMAAGIGAPEAMLPALNSLGPMRAEPVAGRAHPQRRFAPGAMEAPSPAIQRQRLLSASSPVGRQNVVPVAALR
ncbi:hypothetical protein [Xanthomonas axonopodis]|uniref:hypothetical protein n=1 Tax=Xanthomonas axonopodis TaxID=53413 RepID=UPI0013DDADA5|nr:hypothetical protein [Xanthomonas axonopodis]